MRDFLATRRQITKPIRNKAFITTATCTRCDWKVIFADRDRYAENMADAHEERTGHHVKLEYKGRQTTMD
jgi:hypothetical protein